MLLEDKHKSNPSPIQHNLTPTIFELIQRVASLEAKVDLLEKQVEDLRGKVWLIIAGIVVSILVQILIRLTG
jgi:polyhydroxyalkanoate synthesis regulator phasin